MTNSFSTTDRFVTRDTVVTRFLKVVVGALVGIVLLFVAFGLLIWNESRAVTALRGLGAAATLVVEAAPQPLDPSLDGRLVHVCGPLAVTGALADPAMGLRDDEAVRLRRTVSMYQWRETKTTDSQTKATVYTYAKAWSDTPIDSSAFKRPSGHENGEMPLRTEVFTNPAVGLGAYALGQPLIDTMTDYASLPPPRDPPAGYQLVERALYKGDDPGHPALGDLRVSFDAVAPTTVSVMAAQRGASLAPYTMKNGYQIGLVDTGTLDASAMLAKQRAEEKSLTWILRGVGFLLFLIALLLIVSPLRALANLLPFLGAIVGGASFLFALGGAIPLTLATIALAWMTFRPLIGLGLLAAALVCFLGLRRLHARRRTSFLPAPGFR